ncbi:NAD(P)-dependent oxidoreductase [Kocuria aegyptia]|uniref:NAD(P)-binding domain-containing protein n=1 Tax=Kocuria aegyptia TaxID=330943 RepID=A0ABN2KA77_9MICC
MRVVVFGADTAIGRETVTDLVFRGHRVSAVLTDPAHAPADWADRVHLHVGDPLDTAVVDAAVAQNEVVINVLCAVRNWRRSNLTVNATPAIVGSMNQHGRTRYIGLQPAALFDHARYPDTWRRSARLLWRGWCPRLCREVATDFHSVASSALSWTLVRHAPLTEGPSRGVRHVGMTHRDVIGASITRTDAARFLAAQALETSYICAAPAISN